jgi:hypothetical protein
VIAILASLLFSVFPIRGSVVQSLDSSQRIQPFPGTGYPSGTVDIAESAGKWTGMDASGMIPICSTMVSISPENDRRFVLHGATGDWAIWADSVQWKGGHSFDARWRWSRIDTSVPWVRWVDTVRLAGGTAPVGLPMLTTLRDVALGQIGPSSPSARTC